jgi:hypothetical protein
VLERRLAEHDALAPNGGPELRARLDRVIQAAQGRHAVVSDLARDVRFRYFDEPLLEGAREEVYAAMAEHLDVLGADPQVPDRAERIRALVWCHQPLRPMLRDRYRRGGDAERAVALEVNLRRFYRIRDIGDVTVAAVDGQLLATAEYPWEGATIHLATAYADSAELDGVLGSIGRALKEAEGDREPVVGLSLWRQGEPLEADAMSEELRERLTAAWSGSRLHRVDITITTGGAGADHTRTQHFTYRHDGEAFTEERLFRNLHPMLAKRLELWRLDRFAIERLPSVEDVYLFHGTAEENPADRRLFAIAEVRDLTPILEEGRIVALPHLERMAIEALQAIRRAQAQQPPRQRLLMNRLILYVRPPWDVHPDLWRDLAHRLAPFAYGLDLEKVVVRVQLPQPDWTFRDAVLHVENVAEHGVTVRREPVGDEPIKPLTGYGLKVLKSRRLGAPYPYELIRRLTPPTGSASDLPTGSFVEYDLASEDGNRLAPVEREHGCNTAGVVVGVITSSTEAVPEGMRRVAILGDPTRSLGSLAEAECRRIIGAIDLADELGVPVEWYAAVGRRAHRDGQRHREHGLDRRGAAPDHRVHPGRRRDQRRGHRHQRRRPAVLERRGHDAHAHQGHPRHDAGQRHGADRQAVAGLLRRGVGRGQLRHRRLRAHHGAERPGAVLGAGPRERLRAAAAPLRAHLRRARRALPAAAATTDPVDRDVRSFPHAAVEGTDFTWSATCSPPSATRSARSRSTSAR